MNWYEYGSDNPITHYDPTGLEDPQSGGVWDGINGAKRTLNKVSNWAWQGQQNAGNPFAWMGFGAVGLTSTVVNWGIPENQDEAALMYMTADVGLLASNGYKAARGLQSGAKAIERDLARTAEVKAAQVAEKESAELSAFLDQIPADRRQAVLDSFTDGKPKLVTTTEPMTVFQYRAEGDTKVSRYFSPTDYSKSGNAQRYLALPTDNTAAVKNAYVIPKGTKMLEGTASDQTRNPLGIFGKNAVGGGRQIYVPDPSVPKPLQ